VKRLKRVRRENTTEMILEPIKDFNSEDYSIDDVEIKTFSEVNIHQSMNEIETVFINFYLKAAEKVVFLSEVSTFLEGLAKKHQENLNKFQ
jgi:hypothetical protein